MIPTANIEDMQNWAHSIKGGVDWALDENNRKLITPAMEARINGRHMVWL